jgi:predicted transposase YbfD/YdcC
MASGEKTVRAIGQWVKEREAQLIEQLEPPGGRLPSVSTLYRALRTVDLAALEAVIGASVAPEPKTEPAALRGQSLDGKTHRGALSHGRSVHLVSLTCHGSGVVLTEQAVEAKANEIIAAPQLLAGRDLTGTVTTMDALLAQRSLLAQIRRQGGHYLVVIKRNQPTLHADIALWFAQPVRLRSEAGWAEWVTIGKEHGRLERRHLVASTALNDYLLWPDVGQVLQRTCRRLFLGTGEVQEETSFGLTSLKPEDASAAQLEALWRGHWTIENRLHYVRDVTFGEDAGQAHCGSTPQALAAIRNAIIARFRRAGWRFIPDALRHYAASPDRALRFVGALPP